MMYNLRRYMTIGLVLSFIAVVVFSSQRVVHAATSRAQASNGAQASFRCVARPRVQAPQPLTHNVAVQATQKPECPTGQVPQPLGLPTVSNASHFLPSPQQAHIAQGYHYVYGLQYIAVPGNEAYFSQHTPRLDVKDDHTLAETAAQSTDGNQIVEIGWTVDRGVNGDAKPHLFVFSWVNRVPNCYNGCGYVQYSNTFRPGQVVAGNGVSYLYAIEYYQGNWWLYSQNQWLGYFPESLWSSKHVKFTQTGLVQWFGEISSEGGTRTQMGDGIFGTKTGSATITNAALLTSPTTTKPAHLSITDTNPTCYNHRAISTTPAPPPGTNNSFAYGGPGC